MASLGASLSQFKCDTSYIDLGPQNQKLNSYLVHSSIIISSTFPLVLVRNILLGPSPDLDQKTHTQGPAICILASLPGILTHAEV
jgi:hypothetical protein